MEIFSDEPLIKQEHHEALRNYKYNGRDDSIFYRFIVSPLCDKIVEYFPKWLAPNVITLIGIIVNFIMYFTPTFYSGFSGIEPVPGFACYFCSFLYMSYYFLDNLDGKQARRTKTSSPLGTIMDHSCDSMTSVLITGALGSVVGCDSVWQYALLWCMVCLPFFTTIWEENATGFFYLPVLNGVGEGTVCACIVFNIIGHYTKAPFMSYVHIFNMDILVRDIAVFAFFSAGVFFAILNIVNVLTKFKDRRMELISQFKVFFYLLATLAVVSIYGRNSYICREYPKLVIIAFGCCFSQLAAKMLYTTLVKAKTFEQDTLSNNVFFLLCNIAVFLIPLFGTRILDTILIFGCMLNLLSWFFYINKLTIEMADVLSIERFRIKSNCNKNE